MVPSARSPSFLVGVIAAAIIIAGMSLRIAWMDDSALWCDEAESSINALTILETGWPGWKYLDLPVYENTLTEVWPEHPEYEFRDSSYSPQGVTVYHGWLPLYAIAASQALFGLRPDRVESPPRVPHGPEQVSIRTIAPRVPALVFAFGAMIFIFLVGRELGGATAGLGALTLMAFNAKTVDFGFQARYYSLTLFLTSVAAWCLIQVVRRGRLRDFLALGVAEALLFHTHQFSALVFAVVAAALTPVIVRQPGWFFRSVLGGGVAAALILPWIWFSGFFSTASSVPKVYRLFDSLRDWLSYSLDRPVPMTLLVLLAVVVTLTYWRPEWLPRRVAWALRRHGAVFGLLLFWLLAAYVAFHVIVPAASFFFERLSLVLWTPFILILGVFVADIFRRLRPRRAAVLVVVFMIGFLAVRNRLAFSESTSIPLSQSGMESLVGVLESMKFQAGTKFYATPNDHLTFTYYTGLPVQSIAPIRREFLESYEHPVVFIERQMEAYFPDERDLNKFGLTEKSVDGWKASEAVWQWLVAKDIRARGGLLPDENIPESLRPLSEATRGRALKFRGDYIADMRYSPVLRGVPADQVKDIWMGFFYRFVDPASRIGTNLQILPRLRDAEVVYVPRADAVVFTSAAPAR